ncbi:MAG: adenylate/guanylate cyclase domain-containing protein [Acidimicrobiales bacterium]
MSYAGGMGAAGGHVAPGLQGEDPLTTARREHERLTPYLPRLAVEWLAESPAEVHRRLEGTLLFVDVSGFTALTERLAARGKVGAEEITDVIGSVFSEMLGVAAAYGADLLKWGGDASLLFFSGPMSAARACRAAVLMSRTMSRIGHLRTSAGRVNLGVSIGAHSGAFDFYLLGDRHRELVVTGPAATETARMETIAEAGEVLVSRETASHLDRAVLGEAKLEGVLLARAPDAAEVTAGTSPSLGDVDVACLLSAETRAHLLGGGEQAEHRQATVAFVAFSGVDTLSVREGPQAVAADLGPLVRSAQEAAEVYGASFHSTDIGPDGGKIILLGGVPVQRGNDTERVLRSVHDIVTAHPVGSRIGLRVGVNAGRVFVFSHDVGLGQRRIFSITGDAVNLAARVMGQAGQRQVLATDDTVTRARNPFETEPVPPFHVKGKTEPVLASAVGAPLHNVAAAAGDGLSFVGRDDELADLLRVADAAAAGVGSVVEIVGAAGIGKSRLVSEAIDRWPLDTLRVACEEYGSATPYLAFRRVFRRLLAGAADAAPNVVAAELRRVVAHSLPELVPFLPLLADVVDVPVPSTRAVDELEPRFRRARLEHCAVQLLRVYLTSPSALVLEDAHVIDEASASLLGRLLLELGELPLLVVVTREPGTGLDLPEAADRMIIELQALDVEAAQHLAREAGGPLIPPAQIAVVIDRANGNPLFLRELLRAAAEAGGVDELPESLEPLLAAQIDHLSPSDRQVLRAAAVLGGHFDPELLPELLDSGVVVDDAVWQRLGAFVTPTAVGRRFAHGLMRDAAYEGLAFRRRRELHVRAARAIEARTTTPDDVADLLSIHWMHAEGYEQAWRYSRLAGEHARALWAHAEAATFFARALDAAHRLGMLPPAEVSAVAEALGDACELSAGYERAGRAYSEARRLGGAGVQRARLLRKTGVLYERQGKYRQALNCYTRGRHLLASSDRAARTERAELDLASAGIRSRQGRYQDCWGFATEAASEAVRARHRAGLAHALYLQHMMSIRLGRPEDDLGRRALAIFQELGDLVGQGNALNNLGIAAYYRGDWVEAREHYEHSRDVRARSGDVVGTATEENNIAEILSDQGHLEAARGPFESARATWLAAGYRVGVALATSNLGRLAARGGDVALGRQLLATALDDFQSIRSVFFAAEAQVRLAECQLLEGEFSAAAVSCEALLGRLRGRAGLEPSEVSTLRILGTARTLAGVTGAALEESASSARALDEAIERATALGAQYELALCLATAAAVRAAQSSGEQASGEQASGEQASGERPSREPEADGARAEEIFDQLGVSRAVITWSKRLPGGPIFARGTNE